MTTVHEGSERGGNIFFFLVFQRRSSSIYHRTLTAARGVTAQVTAILTMKLMMQQLERANKNLAREYPFPPSVSRLI